MLGAIALAGLAAAATAIALALASDHVAEPGLQGALFAWMILPYILAGLIAWWRRPDSRFGPLMVAAGFTTFASIVGWANVPILFTLGQTLDLVPLVVFLHVFLAFPTGRLQGRFERVLVVTAYLVAIAPVIVRGVLGEFGSQYLLEVVQELGAAEAVRSVQLLVISAFCLAGIGVLAARRRGAGRPLRRSVALLVDSFALGLVMSALLLISGNFGWPAFEMIRRATFVVIGIAPLVFLVGLLSARLARGAVGDLLVELREDPAPADLRDALARAVGDPSLTLAYWLPEFGAWVDSDGREIELPGDDDRRATTVIDRHGEKQLAALVHDRSLADEPELLDAVSAAAAIAVENGRLQAELRAHLEELRGSRQRLIEAGQAERQRLERDLHDGAQQRLIALSLELTLLEESLDGDRRARERVDRARRQVALSLQELRDVARGIHPAVVSGHGLAVALESLAATAAVPVRLTVDLEGRVEERLEVAAYYVVCECLTNIDKHARAASASVAVARSNGQLVVEVVDDGVGGADTERGTGLRGLADRVEALGGRLRVWTPRGGGTRVRAEIPCA